MLNPEPKKQPTRLSANLSLSASAFLCSPKDGQVAKRFFGPARNHPHNHLKAGGGRIFFIYPNNNLKGCERAFSKKKSRRTGCARTSRAKQHTQKSTPTNTQIQFDQVRKNPDRQKTGRHSPSHVLIRTQDALHRSRDKEIGFILILTAQPP